MDDAGLADTGTSTLTTDGHVYATDTYAYDEDSYDNATDSSESLNSYAMTGSAIES